MTVKTEQYQFSHCKTPRGYGLWAFQIGNDPEPFWYTGKYSVAKDSAVRYAVAKGAHHIKVLP